MEQSSGIDVLDRIFSLLDKHFVAFSLLLLATIFRKGIGGILDRVTKLFIRAPGGYSGGIDAVPPISESAQLERVGEVKSAEPDEISDEEQQPRGAEEKQSLWDAYLAAKDGDLVSLP
jgi:hypothetical protein